MMARTMILPAALRYQAEVADGGQRDQGGRRGQRGPGRAAQDADGDASREFQKAIVDAGQGPRTTTPRATPIAHAKYIARPGPAGDGRRCATLGDKLETMVADDLWPLPTYREMLFIK